MRAGDLLAWVTTDMTLVWCGESWKYCYNLQDRLCTGLPSPHAVVQARSAGTATIPVAPGEVVFLVTLEAGGEAAGEHHHGEYSSKHYYVSQSFLNFIIPKFL